MYWYRCKPALPFLPHSLYIITLVKTGTALYSLPVLLFLRAQYFSHPCMVVDPQTCRHKLCTHVFFTPCPPLLPFLRPDLSHQVSWLGWNTLLFPRVIKSVLWNSPISTTLLYPPTLPYPCTTHTVKNDPYLSTEQLSPDRTWIRMYRAEDSKANSRRSGRVSLLQWHSWVPISPLKYFFLSSWYSL